MHVLRLLWAAVRILTNHHKPEPMTGEEVDTALAQLAREHKVRSGGEELKPKTSAVDLFKTLGLDSSLHNRREVAAELGFKGAFNGSPEDNVWLIQKINERFAAGEPIPAGETDVQAVGSDDVGNVRDVLK